MADEIPMNPATTNPLPSERSERNRILGTSTGLSVAVVVILLGSVASNLLMFSEANQRTTKLETKIDGTNEVVREIRTAVTALASSTQSDVRDLQRENADARERFAREIGELRVQMAEIRSSILTQGR